jgi:two-component sensor histidine kinase
MQPEVASVFITDQLALRGAVRPRLLQERLPMRDLARAMIDNPQQLLPVLVDTAMDQCEAVSGGMSLYETEPAPGIFRWHHLRGDLQQFNGAVTPRFYSPCGVTLDQRKPILVQRPERVYQWLQDANVSLPECLLVPLYRGADEPLGTLWLVSKDEGHFDANHAQIATEMASFAGLALRLADHDRKLAAALERQEMLVREMSHRMKNVLSVVQSLLNMAAHRESTAQDLAQAMARTLQALSAAHDTMRTPSDERNAPRSTLKGLLKTILLPYSGHTSWLEGADIPIGPNAANVLALIFHELATNAAKYGAFSLPGGRLDVIWQEGDRVRLTWKESGGPLLTGEPKTSGFGSHLAAKSIIALRGSLTRSWGNSGLNVTIDVPMAQLNS